MNPVQIKIVDKKSLFIKWDDKSESTIDLQIIRKYCPCATCIAEKEKQGKYYIPLLEINQIGISKISTIGNYALGITWNDGHNTGIYEYPYLKSLSTIEFGR